MEIKGAIFDMDGTLLNSLFFWETFWKKLGKRYLKIDNFEPDEALDRYIRTAIFRDGLAAFRKHYDVKAPLDEIVAFSESGLEEFYRNEAHLKAGALALLEHLKGKSMKLVLASATTRRFVEYAADVHGLTPYFEDILSCDDLGVGKDKPDIFLLALEKLNCEPNEVCMFEDSFVALETAKSLGMKTVGIFDRNNYNQERLRASADIYVGRGEALDSLTCHF